MKNFLLFVLVAVALAGCGTTVPHPGLPSAPAATVTPTPPAGNLWGDSFDSAVSTCGELYAEMNFTTEDEMQQNVNLWTGFCQCYYSAIATKVNYQDYMNNPGAIDSQNSTSKNLCLPPGVTSSNSPY